MTPRLWIASLLGLATCGGQPPASAPEVATREDVLATAPALPDVAAADDVAPADTGVASAETGVAPAETGVASADTGVAPWPSEVEGMPPEVLRRITSATPGCVGISTDGKMLLSIVELEGGLRQLMLADLPMAVGDYREAMRTPLDPPSAIFGDPMFLASIKGKTFSPCREVLGSGPLRLPKAVPVVVQQDAHAITVSLDTAGVSGLEAIDNAPFTLVTDLPVGAWKLAGAYFADDEHGAVFLRLVNDAFERYSPEPLAFGLVPIGAAELGHSRCVPRPRAGKPASASAGTAAKGDTTTVPPFDPAPADGSCVAMTAAGDKAAFKMFRVSHVEGQPGAPNRIEWFGPGVAPDIDLSCMARKCKPEQQAAITAAAEAAGLIGCGLAKGAIVLDGALASFMYKDDSIRLKGGSGWRTVHRLNEGAAGAEQALWRVFQRPTGGPIYLYVGEESPEAQTVGVRVLDEAALGLCPKGPEDALVIAEVKASSAERDGGGYRRGAAQLVDGDLTTAWLPGVPKKGRSAELELTLDGEREVTGLAIGNGFQRVDGHGDHFTRQARVAELVVTFGDGTSERLVLADVRGIRRYELTPRRTSKLVLTLAGLHPGKHAPDAAAMSELHVLGR